MFWHAASGAWIMVVALSRAHQVAIYRSANLIDWQLASEWGPHGCTSGQWECPDLIELPAEGDAGATIWMLKVDVDQGVIGSCNGTQLFFGSFDAVRPSIPNRPVARRHDAAPLPVRRHASGEMAPGAASDTADGANHVTDYGRGHVACDRRRCGGALWPGRFGAGPGQPGDHHRRRGRSPRCPAHSIALAKRAGVSWHE